jgi:hypothetical protein
MMLLEITTIGDKNQVRCSDARLFDVKLTKFTGTKHSEGNVDNIFQLCNCLTEIISITYSKAKERHPRQILRLYNQTFFGYLCKSS